MTEPIFNMHPENSETERGAYAMQGIKKNEDISGFNEQGWATLRRAAETVLILKSNNGVFEI